MSELYFKNIKGKKSRPFTIEELRLKGNLFENDLIWRDGLLEWTKAKDIEELSKYAIKEPPKTNIEIVKETLGISIKKTLTYYIYFSLSIGVFSALLEKYQFQKFINSIEHIDHSNDYSSSSYKNNNRNLVEYSNIREEEIYAKKNDGSFYTRWTSYSTLGTQDNEQINYDKNYRFMFRPYKAIFDIVNLSNEERKNIFILLSNFVFSSFVSNIFLLPIIFLLLYRVKSNKI